MPPLTVKDLKNSFTTLKSWNSLIARTDRIFTFRYTIFLDDFYWRRAGTDVNDHVILFHLYLRLARRPKGALWAEGNHEQRTAFFGLEFFARLPKPWRAGLLFFSRKKVSASRGTSDIIIKGKKSRIFPLHCQIISIFKLEINYFENHRQHI